MERLGVFLQTEETCNERLMAELQRNCDVTYAIKLSDASNLKTFMNEQRNVGWDEVVFICDSVLGPFFPLDDFINYDSVSDIYGLAIDAHKSYKRKRPIIQDALIKLRGSFIFSDKNMTCFEKEEWISELCKKGSIETHITETFDFDGLEQASRYVAYPYECVKYYGYPFLAKECFEEKKIMTHSLYLSLSRLFEDYRESKTINEAWKYAIRKLDPVSLKKLLHLNYIIPDNIEKNSFYNSELLHNKKIAVFAHLFYEDLYEDSLLYLKNVPDSIDIYLSTTENNIEKLRALTIKHSVRVKKIVAAGQRGRDAGALLVAFSNYTKKYEYFCFLHDKKSSGGLSPDIEGESFRRLLWDNLLGSRYNIEYAISLMEENRYLGLLSSPIPIMGTYAYNLVGKEWTICYNETVKLAKMLNLKVTMNRSKHPYMMGMGFWCKKEALIQLIEYPWKYEDFPNEPIKLDGEINHAIERILIYLARENGYYSAHIATQEYSSLYLEDLKYLADTGAVDGRKKIPFCLNDKRNMAKDVRMLHRFSVFYGQHPNIYIYGAGTRAKEFRKRMNTLNLKPIAHIVSSHNGNANTLMGRPVYSLDEIENKLDDSAGVVVAMSNVFAIPVVKELEKRNIAYFFLDIAK